MQIIKLFKIIGSDYKGTLTPISHYEPTISDSKALKELLKFNNTKASVNIKNNNT